MKIIKVDAIDSTNTFLKDFLRKDSHKEAVCIWAKHQYAGRGQMGNVWNSEVGKNLTFSFFHPLTKNTSQNPFILNMLVSLSIWDTLIHFETPFLKIKWPNDIMSVSRKIGGILIENCFQKDGSQAYVIGIGINVNQTNFDHLPKASSLQNITNSIYDIESLLITFLKSFENKIKNVTTDDFETIKNQYESLLFKKGKVSTFKNLDGSLFLGIIKGITNSGKLILELEDGVRLETYDIKEIQLMY